MSIRVEEGPDDDWAEVVALHEAQLRRYIGRHTPDRGLVDDILQDTYLRAVRTGRHPRRTELTDEGWLRMLARRASVDAYRGAKRRAAPVDYLSVVGDPLTSASPVTPGSDEHVDAMVSRDAVRWAFRRLSPRQQRLLVLRGLEGLTYQEMAASEQTTVEATASALNRARERLREGIRRYEASGPRRLPALVLVAHDALRRLRDRVTRTRALMSPHLMELAGATVALGVAGVLAAGATTMPVAPHPVTAGVEAGAAMRDAYVRLAAAGTVTDTTTKVAAAGSGADGKAATGGTPSGAPRALVEATPDIVIDANRTWLHVDLRTAVVPNKAEGTAEWDCSQSTLAAPACPWFEQLPAVDNRSGSSWSAY